jgi:mono/diheme cytochrome c family protein
MKRALLLLALVGCTRPAEPVNAAKPAPAAVDAGVVAPPPTAEATLQSSCQSCHSLSIVEQQRLTSTAWAAALKKMKTFGAAIEDGAIEPVAAELAQRRGPNAVVPAAKRIDASEAAQLFVPLEDGALAGGDAAQGKTLYETRCLACHGADARGGIGVNLVDSLVLQRAVEFAATVRTGRGLMPPQTDFTDAQLGQVLAYLRAR